MNLVEAGVRADLVMAHRDAIGGLAAPGTWWTSEQRIGIAAEVRRALTRPDLAPWQSPSAIGLPVDPTDSGVLPAGVVDVIWRITNHPGTLTSAWYDAIVTEFASPRHYVELVGLVAALNAIERFALSLGLDPMSLPAPGTGRPRSEQPGAEVPEATVTTHWVPTATTHGPNVLQALSAVPTAFALTRSLSDAQYVPAVALLGDLTWNRGTLSRPQIELVAAQTSIDNECFY